MGRDSETAIVGRILNEAKKERRKARMAEADPAGWTVHTQYHWSRIVAGRRLDYWPSSTRFRYGGGKTMVGDVYGFIRKREVEVQNDG